MDYYAQKEYIAQGLSNSLSYIHPTLPTLQEQIEAHITELKSNLQKQEELLKLLRRNPDIQRVFELMG